MAVVDIESLKPEDIKIVSTPQNRNNPEPKEEEKTPEEKPDPAKPDAKKDEVPPVEGEQEELPGKPETEENPEEEDEVEPEFDWEKFSEEVGIELDGDDAVVASLKELAEYKTLSPALQKAIEIERNQGDVAAYFKSIANDPKDLSDREALWEQYVTDNPKRVAANPKFARLDFDRKLDKEYSLLSEYEKLSAEEKDEFLEEHKDELEYLKEKRKFDAESARATLQEKRASATFAPSKDAGPSEERLKEVSAAHEAGYKKALTEFDVVSLGMGKDFEFNVGLTESNKSKVQEWMKHPDKFLNELGFAEGKIDYDTLAGYAALIADIRYGNFGERVRQAILDNKDINTLENTLNAPGMTKGTGADKPLLQGDDWDKVGDAFEKKRMESKKKR